MFVILVACCVVLTACGKDTNSAVRSSDRGTGLDPPSGVLEITAKDAHEKIYLMGAGYRLYDSEGTQVEEGYTDAFGKLVFRDLPCGSYTCQAFKAPKGFTLDETAHPVTINARHETVTRLFKCQRRPGTIRVQVCDPDGSPLAGAAFLLEFSTDKGSHWFPVSSRDADNTDLTRGGCTSPGLENGQLTTDARGTAVFTGLRADSLILYRLSETKAPPGVTPLTGPLFVGTLPKESENIYAGDAEVFDSRAFVYTLTVNAADGSLFRLPDAGSRGCRYLSPAMLLFAASFFILENFEEKEKTT